ncbi:NADH-quinone oxidoreductase subunit L [Caproiciproducens galactitolivorans]|uniref:Proton-conducting transporter membrane subunit n=1 Tax=Caproiciproducens galactitolivorans TaxID=642589 RepID=A0ABT4BUS1_9FIRM|nr:proton-conducting transporter membrane subunit [Caproiciproducens galactitolivorans]MCY1714647.1 proton-conducting transporter membrane subunit [Caproiciproducens galactitolivorans]
MEMIATLMVFPFLAALLIACAKPGKLRDGLIFCSSIVIVATVLLLCINVLQGGKTQSYLMETQMLDRIFLIAELGLMGLVFYYGIRYKRYYILLLSAAGTLPVVWMEFAGRGAQGGDHIVVDYLTLIMCLVVGVVGSLICVYAIGYIKDYHKHHTEYKDRSSFFLSMLFVFMGAMFGLIFSSNLTWIYFFWEVTTFCSFLLIGYTQTEEAINNSFRALWMNLLGGLGFACAILYSSMALHIANLQDLVAAAANNKAVIIPVTLLAFAAMTKSAQMPFSRWLLGAMVAPTPTSALLHSATMVKAGVYLLIRLSPALYGNLAGVMVTSIGGFTFFAASLLAISQSDGKKVLAYSTISNLGLIAACAGVGLHQAVWAAILLLVFHAVSKSLLFVSVGAVENITGSRNIEDMHGLIVRLPKLAFVMIVGICGMFLAPFGMLISKWAALKAFVDSKSVWLVLFLIFGSASTLFYWGKWLGKLVAVIHRSAQLKDTVRKSEKGSIYTLTFLVIALCISFPVFSNIFVEPFLSQTFHDTIGAIISSSDLNVMLLMLCMIVILPVTVRLLTFGKANKRVISYMAGVNEGDDRTFVDSFGHEKSMYLANWYMDDYFGEKKLLKPSLVLASAIMTILMIIVIGGAI